VDGKAEEQSNNQLCYRREEDRGYGDRLFVLQPHARSFSWSRFPLLLLHKSFKGKFEVVGNEASTQTWTTRYEIRAIKKEVDKDGGR